MKLSIFSIILLLGVIQGLIFSLMLLFSGNGKRQSKYFLAAFMLVLAYNSFGTFYWSAGLNIKWLDFFDSIFPFTFLFSVGPSFYLYIKSTIRDDRIPKKNIILSYLPALIDLSFRLCLLVYAILNTRGLPFGITAIAIDSRYQPLATILTVIIFWAYLVAAILRFRNRSSGTRHADDAASYAEQKLAAKWIKVLLIIMALVALVWAITIFDAMIFHITHIGFFEPIEIVLVIFVYWIGLRGYQLTRVVYISEQKAARAYAESLTSAEIENHLYVLISAMERDKLYLDPSLTVKKLGDLLDLPPRVISAVLNNTLKKGFIEFVNDYRIKEVKSKMLQPAFKNLTIAGIALESGFNSIPTFQRVFKNAEKVSPKQYLSSQSKQIK